MKDFLKFVGGAALLFFVVLGCLSAEWLVLDRLMPLNAVVRAQQPPTNNATPGPGDRVGPPVGSTGPAAAPKPAPVHSDAIPEHEPTARVFNTKGQEICQIFSDPKTGEPNLQLLPDTPSSMHTWEQCSYELYRAVRYFDARGRHAQDRIDRAMKDLAPPPAPTPAPPSTPAAPEPKK